jgi:AcrR family transcriptional regulator
MNLAPIAARLGLVTSAIYRHYSSKEEILDAVSELIDSRLAANVSEASRISQSPLARLEFLLRRHVVNVRQNSGIPRLLFSGEVFGGGSDRRERLLRLIDGYLARVAKIIRAGQRAGSIRTDVDAPTLAVHFLGIVQPAVILGHLSGGRFDVVRHAKNAWRMFVDTAAPRDEG